MMDQIGEIGGYPIVNLDTYQKIRPDKYAHIMALKEKRRVFLGPHATLLFENAETLWWQIQEMLRIEKGGADQLADELEAYSPLLPSKNEWVATLMIEIPDAIKRPVVLGQLGHIEEKIHVTFVHGNITHQITAVPSDDQERTTADGKTSAVHFLHFPFTQEQSAAFLDDPLDVVICVAHPAYHHQTPLPLSLCEALRAEMQTA